MAYNVFDLLNGLDLFLRIASMGVIASRPLKIANFNAAAILVNFRSILAPMLTTISCNKHCTCLHTVSHTKHLHLPKHSKLLKLLILLKLSKNILI